MAALVFVGISFINGVEVSAQADLTCAHLCNDRAYRSISAPMCGEGSFSWPDPESEELPTVFGRFPGQPPVLSHRPTDDGFRGCHEGPE